MPAFDKAILKRVAEAQRRYGLIAPGDRIAVAVSGGKDSSVLAWALSALRPVLGFGYELRAVHVSSDFSSSVDKPGLAALLAGWGLPMDEIPVPVVGRLKEGRRMNCYWCSTQRRTELIRYALREGFGKIALGHHMDDVLETFIMNMTSKGELSTMPARLSYAKYPLTVIRPLALVEERQIIGFRESAGFAVDSCACPYGTASKREDARAALRALTGGASSVKRRIHDSLGRVRPGYLSGIVEGEEGLGRAD